MNTVGQERQRQRQRRDRLVRGRRRRGRGRRRTAPIANQGYVAVNKANVLYGAIAANNDGDATMGFTLSRDLLVPERGLGRPRRERRRRARSTSSAAGQLPEDGFTGYVVEGGAGTARWGDYSAATADENGEPVDGHRVHPRTRRGRCSRTGAPGSWWSRPRPSHLSRAALEPGPAGPAPPRDGPILAR